MIDNDHQCFQEKLLLNLQLNKYLSCCIKWVIVGNFCTFSANDIKAKMGNIPLGNVAGSAGMGTGGLSGGYRLVFRVGYNF